MNLNIPRTFIQIHYHNRPGGVARVIEGYFKTFDRTCRSNKKKSVIICKNYLEEPSSNYEVVSVKECDYRRFYTSGTFLRLRCRLFRKLIKIITHDALPKPVCVVAHNLSLGKNIALSAAFSDVVDFFRSDNTVRFYSVIHDMAEEGRVQLVNYIQSMESLGIPVWNFLYPKGKLKYIVLNNRNYRLYKNAFFPVILLPNPVIEKGNYPRLSRFERREIITACVKLSKRDNTTFIPASETVLYPVRIISRKNVLEAVIKVCIIDKANLLIGSPGTSRYDRKLYNTIKKISQRYNLPVLLDIERIREYLPRSVIKKKRIIELVYAISDRCISTSIAEGFGFALFEPWMYYKKVTGRIPKGISKTEIIDLSHLYDSFSIPASWISIEELIRHYYLHFMKMFAQKGIQLDKKSFASRFNKVFIHRGAIDFSILSQKMQFDVLQRIMKDRDSMRVELINCNNKASEWKNDSTVTKEKDTAFIEKNKKTIIDNLTGRHFEKRFRECFYFNNTRLKRGNRNASPFIGHFASLSEFRLLLVRS